MKIGLDIILSLDIISVSLKAHRFPSAMILENLFFLRTDIVHRHISVLSYARALDLPLTKQVSIIACSLSAINLSDT